jgi:hypothetical protein
VNSDFKDAHERHWEDAELLRERDRWANADHLYGMVAECGLKSLMLAFGMPFDSGYDRPQRPSDRKHADGIWMRYESYRCGHPRGAHYVLPSVNPFADWEVSQRYANRSNFDETRTLPHRNGADVVRQLVGAMIPEDETRRDYFDRLRETTADLFGIYLYDEIPPGESEAEYFSFDEHDESAPHYPWSVRWQRGFATLRSVHERLSVIDHDEVESVFGPLVDGLWDMLDTGEANAK